MRIIFLLALLIFCVPAFSQGNIQRDSKIEAGNNFLQNEILQEIIKGDMRISGDIIYFVEADNKVYYIVKQENENVFYACVIFLSDNEFKRVAIPFDFNLERMRSLLFTSEYCFLLMERDGRSGTLYKINLNTNEHETNNSIIDIALYQDKAVLLERRAASVYVSFDNRDTPTTIKENVSFKQILDGGLAIVANSEYSEIIDFISSKNVYSYSDNARPAVPDKYNLVIEIIDDAPNLARGREDDMIYFRIFINGVEAGRTNTGIPGIMFSYTLLCEPGHHVVRMERWRLDRTDGTYKRENNIMQPEPVKLFVPVDRVMKIAVNYDGRRYVVKEFPVMVISK